MIHGKVAFVFFRVHWDMNPNGKWQMGNGKAMKGRRGERGRGRGRGREGCFNDSCCEGLRGRRDWGLAPNSRAPIPDGRQQDRGRGREGGGSAVRRDWRQKTSKESQKGESAFSASG